MSRTSLEALKGLEEKISRMTQEEFDHYIAKYDLQGFISESADLYAELERAILKKQNKGKSMKNVLKQVAMEVGVTALGLLAIFAVAALMAWMSVPPVAGSVLMLGITANLIGRALAKYLKG